MERKILIVEDYISNAEMIAAALTDNGFQVSLLTNARNFISTVSRLRPDLVILDIKLPDADGRDLCNELTQTQLLADIPVIIISALLESSYQDIPCAAAAFFPKPFDIDLLCKCVEQMTEYTES